MLMIISPAKTLDFETPPPSRKKTQPRLLEDSAELIEKLQDYSPADLSALMHISDKLGALNFERFQHWQRPFTFDNAKQALLAFRGDVYTGLEADNFTAEDFSFAQKHLRILSGLYGVLRPLDLMQPYRLEMGTRLGTVRGSDLYDFWGDRISDLLKRDMQAIKTRTLVNLASREYFKAVDTDKLGAEVIEPVFKDLKNGKYKIISFYAKKARGMMSAWVIRHRIEKADGLKAFDGDGYSFNPSMSTAREWVFLRG